MLSRVGWASSSCIFAAAILFTSEAGAVDGAFELVVVPVGQGTDVSFSAPGAFELLEANPESGLRQMVIVSQFGTADVVDGEMMGAGASIELAFTPDAFETDSVTLDSADPMIELTYTEWGDDDEPVFEGSAQSGSFEVSNNYQGGTLSGTVVGVDLVFEDPERQTIRIVSGEFVGGNVTLPDQGNVGVTRVREVDDDGLAVPASNPELWRRPDQGAGCAAIEAIGSDSDNMDWAPSHDAQTDEDEDEWQSHIVFVCSMDAFLRFPYLWIPGLVWWWRRKRI